MTIREQLESEKKIRFDNEYETEGYKHGIQVAEFICYSAIEKQTPKKVSYESQKHKSFDCPNCKKTILYLDDKTRHKHCLNCGQALDWSN